MKIDKLSWYINRLKAMSVPEIKYRLDNKLKNKRYAKRYYYDKNIYDVASIGDTDLSTFDEKVCNIFNLKSIDIQNYVVDDIINIFGDVIDLNNKIDWNKCNISNWGSDKFSKYIEFKNTDDIGDIRYTWEISRHLFFPKLALNYKKTNDKKYIKLLEMHFYNWVKENPFLKGVNWASSMEVIIRCYQWIITYSIIKDDISKRFKYDLVNSIINSTRYVSKNYSLYSSANNHLIVEAVYCGIIGYLIDPIYSNNYLEESYKIIEREILLQNNTDGINKEQATHYQAFVLDAFLQFAFLLKKIGKDFPHKNILFNMSEFIGLLRQSGKVIEFGDSDDAKLISFNLQTKEYYEYVLQLASIYFGTKFLDIESLFDEVKFISQENQIDCDTHVYKEFYVYKDGGYAIFNTGKQFMLFDIGELGFGSIAAHGHADALSIVYSNNRREIFVDPGTYVYNIRSKWRDYFRKTSSHNTLTYKGKDQSDIKGPFLWGKKASTEIIDYGENKDLFYVCASHDGYKPNIHKRSITYIKKEEIFIIKDNFKDIGELNYILNNTLDINEEKSNMLEIKSKNDSVFVAFNNKYKITEKWISKKFLSKSKTKGIKIYNDFNMNKDLYTIVSGDKIKINNDIISFKNYSIKYLSYKEIRRDYGRDC